MDDCWCFYATVPDWNPDENPFEAWKRRPAERVHFHTGYDTFVYPLFFRFTGYFLHNLGYTPRPEPIDFFPGHDVVTLEGKKLSKSHENAPDLDSLLEEWGGGVVRLSVLAGSNPDREISWSTGRLELGRRMLDTVDQLVALQAACSEAPQTEPVATNGGRAAARIAKDLERIDRFVGEYRIGAAVDALYKCSSAALRSGRTVRDVEMRRVCDGLISWWRAFAPENVLHAAPRVS
jgi:leucyl-tRNA synthetase